MFQSWAIDFDKICNKNCFSGCSTSSVIQISGETSSCRTGSIMKRFFTICSVILFVCLISTIWYKYGLRNVVDDKNDKTSPYNIDTSKADYKSKVLLNLIYPKRITSLIP